VKEVPRRSSSTWFFVALVGLTIFLGMLSYVFNEVNHGMLIRGNDVRFELEAMLRLTLDQETGVRGYVGTDETLFLEPYLAANKEYPGALAQLRSGLNGEFASVSPTVDRYDALHRRWISEVVQPLLASKNRAERARLTLLGKNLVDDMRSEERLADRQVVARLNDLRVRNRVTVIVSTATIVVLTIVMGAAALETERRQRREEHRLALKLAEQNEALERSNRLLQEFAYAASHDLQEPLRTVASFTQLLERRYAGRLDGDAAEFMYYIVDGATRMQALIDDILRYSRVTTHGQPLERVDLRDVVKRALLNLRASIDERSAEVLVGDLPNVRGDASQLLQLFQNLIANGIKYNTNDRPRIEIAASRTNGEATLTVRDDGIGIAPEYHERIFRIFQRLHSRSEFPGTGVGLALCSRIVERHGGRIWVDSVEGEGASFSFTLHSQEEETA